VTVAAHQAQASHGKWRWIVTGNLPANFTDIAIQLISASFSLEEFT
jgi:hypothetical protein